MGGHVKKIILAKLGAAFFLGIFMGGQVSASGIQCELRPYRYIGNLYLDIDTQRSVFEISADSRPAQDQTVVLRGTVYNEGQDSMGFDVFSMCTGSPCSGSTYVGQFKAVNTKNDQDEDRVSYFDLNPIFKLRYISLGETTTLPELSEFGCSYK